jgi:hypothetical protein
LWSWDIAPTRPGGKCEKEAIHIHSHLLIETYDNRFGTGEEVHPLLREAWRDTAANGCSGKVVVVPVKQSPLDIENAVRYVTGFPSVAGVRTSKLLKHFAVDKADSDSTGAQGDRTHPRCKPSRDQLRLLLAFYTCPRRIERLLGHWNTGLSGWGKHLAKQPRLERNPMVAPTEFGELTYPKRWRDPADL